MDLPFWSIWNFMQKKKVEYSSLLIDSLASQWNTLTLNVLNKKMSGNYCRQPIHHQIFIYNNYVNLPQENTVCFGYKANSDCCRSCQWPMCDWGIHISVVRCKPNSPRFSWFPIMFLSNGTHFHRSSKFMLFLFCVCNFYLLIMTELEKNGNQDNSIQRKHLQALCKQYEHLMLVMRVIRILSFICMSALYWEQLIFVFCIEIQCFCGKPLHLVYALYLFQSKINVNLPYFEMISLR